MIVPCSSANERLSTARSFPNRFVSASLTTTEGTWFTTDPDRVVDDVDVTPLQPRCRNARGRIVGTGSSTRTDAPRSGRSRHRKTFCRSRERGKARSNDTGVA